MKVAVYYNNRDIRIEERPVPAISDGEILVKMRACGICGTDVMEWYRTRGGPRILGHEMTGEIVEVGIKVERFKKGDRVFVSHHVPCYKCHYCLQGDYTACESLHGGNYDPGGFSEFIRIPEENVRYGVFLLPERMTFEDGAMIEPLACAIGGQKHLRLREGQTVLIIGAGVSGILHIQLSKMSLTKVVALDIDKYRLGKAKEFGADHVIDADKYSAERLKDLNDGRLADAVIVCAAAKRAVDTALFSIGRKGKILFFAVPRDSIILPSAEFWRDEVTVTFSYGAAPEDIQSAIGFIDGSMVRAREMITHKVRFSSVQKGFNLVSEAKDSLKVVVVPD